MASTTWSSVVCSAPNHWGRWDRSQFSQRKLDTCHHTSAQIHGTYATKSDPDVNCGCGVITPCQCRLAGCTGPSGGGGDHRRLCVGEGGEDTETLYLRPNFVVHLKLVIKKSLKMCKMVILHRVLCHSKRSSWCLSTAAISTQSVQQPAR